MAMRLVQGLYLGRSRGSQRVLFSPGPRDASLGIRYKVFLHTDYCKSAVASIQSYRGGWDTPGGWGALGRFGLYELVVYSSPSKRNWLATASFPFGVLHFMAK